MRRILVVEDSASTRSFVRSILDDPAFQTAVGPLEVIEAQSGFDAMRLLPRTRYDLIITDINMPDVNGLELIHFIRRSEQYRTTPLLIISTQATERDVERGRKLGADEYVPKPFTPEALQGAVEKLLARLTRNSPSPPPKRSDPPVVTPPPTNTNVVGRRDG